MKRCCVVIAISILGFCIMTHGQATLDKCASLYQQGKIDEAIAAIDGYIISAPNDPNGYCNKGIMLRQKGIMGKGTIYFQDAISCFGKAARLENDPAGRTIIKGNMATTYLEMNDFDMANKCYVEAYSQSRRFFYRAHIAYCKARQGSFKEAHAIIESATPKALTSCDSPGNEGLTYYNFALVYSLENKASNACYWLKKALELNPKRFAYSLRHDTDLLPILKTTEFQMLLQQYPVNVK